MQLQDMYQEIILDHYRNPHHKGLRDPFDAEVFQVNPTCGDEVTLRVALKDGAGVMVDTVYRNGADYLPPDDVVRSLRPQN